jgi:hypothetical protein
MLDLSGVFLVDDPPLDFHGVGELSAFNGKIFRKDDELLDRLDPGQALVHRVNLTFHMVSENRALGRL